MRVKLSAVIPTVQYGNVQPELEFDGDYEDALAFLQPKMEELWAQYYNKTPGASRKPVKCFVGGSIYYDEATHSYTNEAGEAYLSGSQYAKTFEKPFDGQGIADKMAKKYNLAAEDILKMWELKARTSREFGTALHSALQLYGQYNSLAVALERETHLHDHPTIKSAVQGFYKGRHDERAEYEVCIVDHGSKRAGRVDRLVILGDKKCRVEDYKTNADMTEQKQAVYFKQLDFYGDIMAAHGWNVEPPAIHHFNGSWTTIIKETN